MLYSFFEFTERLHNNSIRISNNRLDEIIRNYSFTQISEFISYEKDQEIYKNLKASQIIIVNYPKEINPLLDEKYLIIGFQKTIIIIETTKLPFLSNFFSSKQNLNICFLSNSKDIFNHYINIQYSEIEVNSNFNEEITNFNKQISLQQLTKSTIMKMWELIQPCISGYLIKQSYLKNMNININNDIQISEDEFIKLRTIGRSSFYITDLIYSIENYELFVVKIPDSLEPSQEIDNYLELSHPSLPKFFGKNNDQNFLLFEFIRGKKLKKIQKFHFTVKDKIKIIFEILIISEFLHRHNVFIHELNSEHILINSNKSIVLINFDSMIKNDDNESLNIILSLGRIMYFIMKEKEDDFESNLNDYSKIDQIIKKCFQNSDKTTISDLIHEIYINYNSKCDIEELYQLFNNHDQINSEKEIKEEIDSKSEIDIKESIEFYLKDSNQNDPNAQFNLGLIYSENKYVPCDMKKAIHYFTIASNLNDIRSQFNLGYIYSKGELVPRDIKKAIYYYTLAANQNDSRAQFNLGDIYFEGEFVPRDVKRAIHFYTLAADQSSVEAQFKLGLIYSECKMVKKDIKKAVYYYSLAAMQNSVEAQFNLGFIYSEGVDVQRDITKAIHYYTLASRQNDSRAQFNLGVIYSDGRFVRKDMNKAIYFYSLAAKQNVVQAQFNLGFIYSEDKEVRRDVEKMIYYYSLAADQNDPRAQYNLGVIYSEGRFVSRDIEKAAHYYALAADQNIPEARYNLNIIANNSNSKFHTFLSK